MMLSLGYLSAQLATTGLKKARVFQRDVDALHLRARGLLTSVEHGRVARRLAELFEMAVNHCEK